MANALFNKAREAYLAGDLAWDTDNYKVVLVDHGVDTPVPATDQFLADIGATARIATSTTNLANKTVTDGVADADNITITGVTGASVESIVIYQDTGNAATSRLTAFIDTATGLPFTPSGGDVTIQWSDDANRIFKL